jgi:hypothetical protein
MRQMWRRNGAPGWATAATILLACAASASAAGPSAVPARSLGVKDEAKLHLVHSSGSTLIDEGTATGTIPGTVKLEFTYDGSPTVSATFTISAHGSSLRVKASGKLSSPTNPRPSFAGTITVIGGRGRYSHAKGTGKLYGVFYRRSYNMTVQTQGTVEY